MVTKKIHSGVLCYDADTFVSPRRDVEYYGLSTDNKPSGDLVENASVFYEMNTGDVWLYDAANVTWLKQ